jgi:hypothetical protein
MLKKEKESFGYHRAKGKAERASSWRYNVDVDLKLWVEFKLFPDGRLNGGGEPFMA